MKTQLMAKRYRAPRKNCMLPLASPNPAVQSGGMRAVAMATPEITVPFSFLHCSNMPAAPPNNAISTS